jgi:hypothetical protein
MRGARELKMIFKAVWARDLNRFTAAAVAGLGWFGLVVQMCFDIDEAYTANLSIAGQLTHFFSYFTIQTNLVVALVLTFCSARPQADRMLLLPSLKSALATYMVIVGLVYALLLRHLWNPQGLQLVADMILHDAIPLLYPLYWLVFLPKRSLRWMDPALWLIYPVIYFIYILVRGAAFGEYPYPFLDVNKLGYGQVSINAVILLAAFYTLGVIFTAIDRSLAWKEIDGNENQRRSQLGRATEF